MLDPMRNVEREFQRIANQVDARGPYELTARDLLVAVGARRRGTNIVAEIRSRLARHQLETQPDFADVHPDQPIAVVHTKDHQPPYVTQLTAAVQQLEQNPDEPRTIRGREMLSWFGVEHMGNTVSEQIRATLAGFDLETNPDFQSVHIDEPLQLVRRKSASEAPPSGATPDAPSEPEATPAAEPRPLGSQTTFHVGTLDEARREIVSTKPQTKLRAALSVMLTEQVSYLPIMRNEYDVSGMLRWKDIGRYLLLKPGADLDDPVESAATNPVTVGFDSPFLDVIPAIIQHGCVLVRGPQRKITGIITKKDLGRRLLELTSPFVTLGEIERGLRRIIEAGEFSASELRQMALDPTNKREVKAISDLTLGEYQRLFEHVDGWTRVGLVIDKKTFLEGLDRVRQVRNGVMHFEPGGPTEADRKRLSGFLEVVYQLLRFSSE